MTRTALSLSVIAASLIVMACAVAAEDTHTLTGEYVLPGGDGHGDLRADFTAIGSGLWEVSFHFSFQEQAHVFSGTAQGSLSRGKLSGKVLNESGNRTFTFTGEFVDGVFTGTHAEIEDGGPVGTGTMTLEG